MAERRSPKPQVGGSIPSWPASVSVVWLNGKMKQGNIKDIMNCEARNVISSKFGSVLVVADRGNHLGGVYANTLYALWRFLSGAGGCGLGSGSMC